MVCLCGFRSLLINWQNDTASFKLDSVNRNLLIKIFKNTKQNLQKFKSSIYFNKQCINKNIIWRWKCCICVDYQLILTGLNEINNYACSMKLYSKYFPNVHIRTITNVSVIPLYWTEEILGREITGYFDRKLRLPRIHFRVLLHAANMRHVTSGFTSLPKEGVLRIVSPWKNPKASAGFEPANFGTKGQHSTSRPPKPLK